MRVLLDENVPHDLIPQFPGHDIVTVQGLGWAGVKNGDLLMRARGKINAFLSVLPFGVVVVLARSNRVRDLLPLVVAMREAVARIGPGEVEHVGA